MTHYHYGSNVAGYLPEGDTGTVDTAEDAKAGLRDDMTFERDGLDYAPERDGLQALYDSLSEAITELDGADVSAGFSTYTSDGGEHRIPTAWWIQVCTETECAEVDA